MINIDGYIRDWASFFIRETELAGGSKDSLEHKLMTLGPDGAVIKTTIAFVPNYWPNGDIKVINDTVLGLPVKLRNIIIARFILGAYSDKMVADICKCDTRTVLSRMEKAYEEIRYAVITRIRDNKKNRPNSKYKEKAVISGQQ